MCKGAEKLIIILLFFPALCFAYNMENVASSIRSPQELSNWLSSGIYYQTELPDYWQSAEETLQQGSGDCEDFAILSSAILTRLKIPNQIIIIKFKGLKQSHAVCVFKDSEFCSFMSNAEMIPTRGHLVKEAVEEIYPDWEAIIFTNAEEEYLKILVRKKIDKKLENQLNTALKNK